MRTPRIIGFFVVVLLALAPAGCANHSLSLESTSSDASLRPRQLTSVYRYGDSNTLDIIVSDMPIDVLLAALSGEPASGNVTHLHLFFSPVPGRTPLDASASNTTIRHVIFADDQIGVYGGGGLLRPSSKTGPNRITATIRGASMRLIDATPGFIDRLGSAEFFGSVAARRNDDVATDAVNHLAALYLRAQRADS